MRLQLAQRVLRVEEPAGHRIGHHRLPLALELADLGGVEFDAPVLLLLQRLAQLGGLPVLLAGSVVIEQVFAVPGLGRLLLTSIEGRDEPVARAIVVLLAFAVILCNLAADLLARRIDPRLGSGAGGAA